MGQPNEFGMGSQIYSQHGTLNDIENPLHATILKGVALLRTINRKEAAHATIAWMQATMPSEVTEVQRGEGGRIMEPRDAARGIVAYPHLGRTQAFEVPKGIADALNNHPDEYGTQAHTLFGKLLGVDIQRKLFIGLNAGWQVFNVARDVQSTMTNVPLPPSGWRPLTVVRGLYEPARLLPAIAKAAVQGAIYEVGQTLGPTGRARWETLFPPHTLGIADFEATLRDMEQRKELLSIMDHTGVDVDTATLERLLHSYRLRPDLWASRITRPIGRALSLVEAFGRASELSTKVAVHRFLTRQGYFTPQEIERLVRDWVGSPPFGRTGEAVGIYNNLLLFSNAVKEGYRRDIEVMRTDPASYWARRAMWSMLPKLLMLMAAIGLLGEKNKRIMDNAGEYYKTNYTVVPITETENGKGVTLNVPQDEVGRLLGGLFWKTANWIRSVPGGKLSDLFDYMAGQAPTLLPLLQVGLNAVNLFARGENPENYQGHPMVPEAEFRAGATYPRLLSFLNQSWNDLGGTVLFPDLPQRVLPYTATSAKRALGRAAREDTMDGIEKLLDMPTPMGVLRPLQRFVRVSDQGTSDRLRALALEVRQTRSQESLRLTTALVEIILANKDTLPLVIPDSVSAQLYAAMQTQGYRVGEFPHFRDTVKELGLIRHGNPYINAYLHAQTREEKAAILVDMLTHVGGATVASPPMLPTGTTP